MKKSRLVIAAVAASAVAISSVPNTLYAALSGTSPVTANLPVTANVPNKCTVSASAVAFGDYDPTANSDATGGVTVQCTKGTAWSISMDDGSVTTAGRQMKHATLADELNYQLYSDASRTSVWGTGSGGSAVTGTAADSSAQNLTVYGRIPSGQNTASVGNYSDTITVELSF